MITPVGEADPNNPEQQASFEQNLVLIKDFINRQLEGVEPYIDDEEHEEVRQSPNLLSASGIAINCSSQRTVDEDEQAEEGGYDNVMIYDTLKSDMRWLYFNNDGMLGLAISEKKKQVELDDLNLEQAKANSDFQETVAFAINGIAETSQAKKEYRRYALPAEVTIDNLSAAEKTVYEQILRHNGSSVVKNPELLPKYRMTTAEGDQWLASSVATPEDESGDRLYAILYRLDPEKPDDMSSHIVYTSLSQGVWRALPYLHKDGWHDKGYGGEAVLNLPIGLQQTLWQISAEQQPQQRPQHEVYDALSSLATQTYDAYLAGAESDFIEVADDDTESPKLPVKTETLEEAFSFTSPLYGNVSASIVPSRDGTIRYLILQEKDGAKWVGMAEPVDAKMLDSFILDKIVRPIGLLYTPAVEYIDRISYGDNRARAAASIAIRALTGSI